MSKQPSKAATKAVTTPAKKKPAKRTDDEVRVEVVDIAALTPDPQNANDHTEYGQHLVQQSISNRGFGRPGLAASDGTLIAGNLSSLEVPASLGMNRVIVVHSRGDMPIVHVRDDIAPGSVEALTMGIEDNEASHASYSPNIARLMQLSEMDTFHDVIPETRWKELLASAGSDEQKELLETAKLNPRHLPLDLIFTFDALNDASCFLAARAGWKIGIRSAQAGQGRIHGSADKPETWQHAFDLTFIDNDYHHYEHAKHLEAVARFKPKYATVRDVMTKTQCKEAGIPYFTLDQILQWAEELNQHAENVIVIPKYDCIADIPDKHVLGYSVPTSHGGTPLSTELFKGHRVHLLGGSWKAQLQHMAALGDDVVSIDNNYIQKMAQYGTFCYPDGSSGSLTEDLGLPALVNPLYVALAITLGGIAAKVNELYEDKRNAISKQPTTTNGRKRASKPASKRNTNAKRDPSTGE